MISVPAPPLALLGYAANLGYFTSGGAIFPPNSSIPRCERSEEAAQSYMGLGRNALPRLHPPKNLLSKWWHETSLWTKSFAELWGFSSPEVPESVT
jgi:hypothetical protein